MEYCYVEDGKVRLGPRELPVNWKRVSNLNKLTTDSLIQIGWLPCEYPEIDFDPLTQMKLSYSLDVQADKVVVNYEIGDKSEAHIAQELKNAKIAVKNAIDDIRHTLVYTDIEMTFPDGPAVIQFRNSIDRLNLSNVVQSAQSLLSLNPDAILTYRTQDNVNQKLTASEMISIGLYVMANKQAIQESAWALKDAVEELTTIAEVESFDITVGWSEPLPEDI